MPTDYHVITLPNKAKVPVRDHFLRDGRKFSASGDVSANGVTFDGTGDVNLALRIGEGKVRLDNISPDAKADTPNDSPEKLATVKAVTAAIESSKRHVVVRAEWRERLHRYVPLMTYGEMRDFIRRGVLPVLQVERDGEQVYILDMTADDGSVAAFRAPDMELSSEDELPGGGTIRRSSTVTTEFKYGPDGFVMVNDDVKPAAYSVESMEI